MADAATVVLLVRHGLTPTTGIKLPGQAPGLHLTDEGRRQAEAAAVRIKALPKVAAVYSSHLERARETGAPIARMRGLALRIDRDLADLDIGSWTGLSLKQASRRPEWEAVQRNPSGFRFPDGESFPEMQARITSALGRLVARFPGQIVVAVSHADPIKAVVAHAMGTHLDLFQRVVVSPCSVTAILYTSDGPVVLCVNSTGRDLTTLAPS